jgi:hypothetical protein
MTYCWMIKVLEHDLLLNDQGPGTWLTVGWSRSWDMTYCWMIKVLGHDFQDLDHSTVSHVPGPWSFNSKSCPRTLIIQQIKVLGHDLLLDDQGPGTWLTVEWSRSWDTTYCWMIKVLGHDLLLNLDHPTVSHVPGSWSSNSKSCPRTLIIQQ